jgi:hypothetical protein
VNKASVVVTFNRFVSRTNAYVELLNKIYDAKRVVARKEQKRELYEALALKIHCSWEVFVENLLIDCLNKDSTQYAASAGIKGIKKHMPRNLCKLLLVGRQYLNFRDMTDIKRQAKRILVPSCNPFRNIPASAVKRMDEFYIIRNYIAHRSLVARLSLEKMYKNVYRMKRFCEPGDFLSVRDVKMKRTRFGIYLAAIASITEKMGKSLGLAAR